MKHFSFVFVNVGTQMPVGVGYSYLFIKFASDSRRIDKCIWLMRTLLTVE